LGASDVHVWRVGLDADAPYDLLTEHLLDADEQARAHRFAFDEDRRHFVIAHAALRKVISLYAGIAPPAVRFDFGPNGKPRLATGLCGIDLRFNLAHSSGLALCALAARREVGVDVEYIRGDLSVMELAERFFSAGEVDELRTQGEADRTRAFFDGWARKEAYIKATGTGLAMALDGFQVSLAAGEPAMLKKTTFDVAEASHWSLRSLDASPEYAAAIAAEGHDWLLRCWQFPPHWLAALP
jgi:4'-phosphopantetheinyl transferase